MKPCSHDYIEERCEKEFNEVQQLFNNTLGEDREVKEAYDTYSKYHYPATGKELYN